MNRRQFIGVSAVAVGVAAFSGNAAAARINEAGNLTVDEVSLPIDGLPPVLDGFTIAQISDIHLRPFTKPEFVQEAVELTNNLGPDLIVLTGDYVWKDLEAIYELTPILANLDARHGVFGVLGNHDIWTDREVVLQAFQSEGLPVLVNQGVPINRDSGSLFLAGLDDGWSGQPDLDAALDNRPANAIVVLLLHEPDLADQYAHDGRTAVQLSGHSHGGQIRLPRVGAPVLPYLGRKYDMGLYRVNDMWLYTNRGIGVTNEPFRINCPPEITLFTLKTPL
jgi:predicted MPP superfamily phosphohydrolase